MDLYEPFLGVLLMPPHPLFSKISTVSLDTGQPVAAIRWRTWRSGFEILDVAEDELAWGRKAGFFSSSFLLSGPGEKLFLELVRGRGGMRGRCLVNLPDGQVLTKNPNSRRRNFTVVDAAGQVVMTVVDDTGSRPRAHRVELHAPVLSIVQAAGLVQFVRDINTDSTPPHNNGPRGSLA